MADNDELRPSGTPMAITELLDPDPDADEPPQAVKDTQAMAVAADAMICSLFGTDRFIAVPSIRAA
jgi:hypothetical protein